MRIRQQAAQGKIQPPWFYVIEAWSGDLFFSNLHAVEVICNNITYYIAPICCNS